MSLMSRLACAAGAAVLLAVVATHHAAADEIFENTANRPGSEGHPFQKGFHLFFDGVDDVATVGDFAPLTVSTIEAWVRPLRHGVVNQDTIDDGAVIVTGGGPRAFCAVGVGLFAAKQSVCYETDPAGCGNDLEICVHFVEDSAWMHLAGVYDGENSRLYVNGTLIHERTGVRFDPGDWMTLGGYQFYNGYQAPFAGDMDEVRIWKVARTKEEIRDAMTAPLTGEEEGLVAYYDFNEGQGKWFRNKAANRYHGYLGGMTAGMDGPKWVPSHSEDGSAGFDADDTEIRY